uniref:PPFIA binding protein 2 n=1 Tax=Oncorhynchus tshawytscha TaxID=74940 RepID=A0A8C8JV10_ONCTS
MYLHVLPRSDATHILSTIMTLCPLSLAGSKAAAEYTNGLFELGSPGSAGPLQVLQLVEDLRLALELQPREEERDTLRAQVPSSTVNLCSPVNNESYQERLVRLEGDKESLVLQVSVLTDQVEAQGEKIRDLESSLEEHYHKLNSTEEMLKQELLSRTSLETQKLDLMDEVSYLKLKLVDMDEEQNHNDSSEDQQNKAEGFLQELRFLKSKVDELEGEKSQYEKKLKATKAEIADLQQMLASKDSAIEGLQSQLVSRDQELQRLKMGMESLVATNYEKDRHIEELTVLLGQYRKMKEVMALTQGNILTAYKHSLPEIIHIHCFYTHLLKGDTCCFHILKLRMPFNSIWIDLGLACNHAPPATPPLSLQNQHIEMNKYQTLPGKLSRPDMNGDREQCSTPDQLSPDDSEDSEFHLRKSERLDESTLSDLSPLSSGVDSGQQSPVSPENKKNHRGIKKLWGKIRKTQSGSLQGEDLEPGEFKRGGLRATAGPRLARAGETLTSVRIYQKKYGLGQYVILARHWADSGQTLLSASPQDLEKEMGIKNPLHRKKLQLALKSFSTKLTEKSSELDHIWVTRWLDDIGLPQYKDQFHQGRVDGRMLQYLTVNNLLFLKVTSQLHHLSVKCAIHVLHVNKFNPNCLKRRPGDENKTSPSEVVQWSNHRVMEWLRSVDLAEYAPNLRGSGVHGGLIILEPRFNSDTLAMLLNIPPQKTLLRRHLSTNFNMLVGSQAQQEKREFMESSGYTPLSTTAKVRPKKLGFSNFGHLRKKRCDDSTDYICPLEAAQAQAQLQAVVNGAHRPYSGFRGLSPILDRDPDRREQVGLYS